MKPNLYLVNTARDLSACGIYDKGLEINQHNKFVKDVQKQIPTFEMPYMAFFDNGTIFIPLHWEEGSSGYMGGKVIGEIVPNGRCPDDCTLAEFIVDNVKGYELVRGGRSKGITGIIEFSPIELYPKTMEELSNNFDVFKKIF